MDQLQELARELLQLERIRQRNAKRKQQPPAQLTSIRHAIEEGYRQLETEHFHDFKTNAIPRSVSSRAMTAALKVMPPYPVLSVIRANTMRLRYHGHDLTVDERDALLNASGSFIALASEHPCSKSKYTATRNGRTTNLVCRRCGKVVFSCQTRSSKNAKTS